MPPVVVVPPVAVVVVPEGNVVGEVEPAVGVVPVVPAVGPGVPRCWMNGSFLEKTSVQIVDALLALLAWLELLAVLDVVLVLVDALVLVFALVSDPDWVEEVCTSSPPQETANPTASTTKISATAAASSGEPLYSSIL